MESISITISPEPRTQKPEPAIERAILSEMKMIEIRPQEFIHIVGSDGHSFFPATFELKNRFSYIDTESFRSSQVLVIDIDNKKEEYEYLSPNQALKWSFPKK